MGLSSDSRQGAFDVDFVAYKEGIHVPTLPPMGLPGDYNINGFVNAADYVVWRKGLGTTYTQDDYNIWRAHFGETAGSGSVTNDAVPEPAT